ncbi:hypothetical protein BGZ76_004683 [Entomortierella beljakovae]|nr:hypothetical protein BGZ76_004683 [Entomortierella beljakovae]
MTKEFWSDISGKELEEEVPYVGWQHRVSLGFHAVKQLDSAFDQYTKNTRHTYSGVCSDTASLGDAATESSSTSTSNLQETSSSSSLLLEDEDPSEVELSMTLKEPWRTLTKLCIDKFHGCKVQGHKDLEGFNLSTIETHLYERVLSYLDEETLSKLRFKDLFVALTGIVDLRVVKFKDFTSICPELEYSDPEVTRILDQLSKYLRLGMRTLVLKCDVMLGLQAQKELDGEDIMPQESMINLVRYLGEHMCKATQVQKKVFASQFGAPEESESGRKVDLLLRIGDFELLNTEAKANDHMTECDTQYKKNLRINHAIYQIAKRRGLTLPEMLPLDIRGLTAMVCSLKSSGEGNIMVAGPASRHLISLPSTKEGLEQFLAGKSAQMLWQYVQQLVSYHDHVKLMLDEHYATSITHYGWKSGQKSNHEELEDNRASTPPRGLNLGDVTVLTPKISKRKLSVKAASKIPMSPKKAKALQPTFTFTTNESTNAKSD